MAAIKGSHVNVGNFAASEISSPEPSVPPEPVYDPEINPDPAELPYLQINPGPAGLPYPDKNSCMAGPLGTELSSHERAAHFLP